MVPKGGPFCEPVYGCNRGRTCLSGVKCILCDERASRGGLVDCPFVVSAIKAITNGVILHDNRKRLALKYRLMKNGILSFCRSCGFVRNWNLPLYSRQKDIICCGPRVISGY